MSQKRATKEPNASRIPKTSQGPFRHIRSIVAHDGPKIARKRDQDCPRIARRIPKIAQGPLGREIALDRQICSCFVTAAKDTCACPGGSTAPPEVPQKGLKQTRNGSEDSSEGPAWLQIGPSAPFTYFHTLFVLSAALPVHCPERFPSVPGRSAAKNVVFLRSPRGRLQDPFQRPKRDQK